MPFQFRKEAIEEDLNSNFPSQGQGNPPLYYSLSEVVVPTYSINNVAEGTSLPENLQTAMDFSTGLSQISNTTSTIISNTGFWRVIANLGAYIHPSVNVQANLSITDGISSKPIWYFKELNTSGDTNIIGNIELVVFLKSGESLTGATNDGETQLSVTYRQIADVNGNLVNPLGFSFA